MICVTSTVFPHGFVYVQVLVIVSGQISPSETSTPGTSPVPAHASNQVKFVIAGTSLGHSTITSIGSGLNVGIAQGKTVTVTVFEAVQPVV